MDSTLKGDIYCILNGVCFLMAAAFTRHSHVANPEHFLFARVLAFLVGGLIYCVSSNELGKLFTDHKLLGFTCLNGFFTVNMNLTYLLTLNHLATSDAYVINRLRIVVTGILSAILCDDPFGIYSIFCTFLILSGAVLIAEPAALYSSAERSYNISYSGYVIIFAAVFFGGANSVTLKLAHKNDCYVTSSQFILSFGVMGLLQYVLSGYIPEDVCEMFLTDWFTLSLHVIISVGTLMFFKRCLDYISAQRFAIVSCIIIPISYIIDALFISFTIRLTSMIGAAFVFVGVYLYASPNK